MWTVLSLLFNSASLILSGSLCLCNLAEKIVKEHKVVYHTFCDVSWQEWHISSTERYITVHFQEDILSIVLVGHIAQGHWYETFVISSNGFWYFLLFSSLCKSCQLEQSSGNKYIHSKVNTAAQAVSVVEPWNSTKMCSRSIGLCRSIWSSGLVWKSWLCMHYTPTLDHMIWDFKRTGNNFICEDLQNKNKYGGYRHAYNSIMGHV
jgi:hypothetical protein